MDIEWTQSRTLLLMYGFVAVGAFFGYGIRALYSRVLSQSMYGLFYAVIGLYVFLTNWSGLGFRGSESYFGTRFYERGDSQGFSNTFYYALIVEFVMSLATAILFVLFAEPIAREYFGDTAALTPIIFLAIYFVFHNLLDVLRMVFATKQDQARRIIYQPIRNGALLFGSISLFAAGYTSVTAIALFWTALHLVLVLGYWAWVQRWFPDLSWSKTSFDKELFKKMLWYGIPSMFSGGAIVLLTRVDTQIITVVIGVSAVALYENAFAFAAIQNMIARPLNKYQFPRMTKYDENGRHEEKQQLFTSIQRFSIVAFGAFALVSTVGAESLLTVLFSSTYRDAAPYLILLTYGFLFNGLASTILSALSAHGYQTTRMYLLYSAAAINLVGSIIGAYAFGLAGVAWTSVITFFALWALCAYVVVRKTDLSYPLPMVFKALSVIAVMLAAGLLTKGLVPVSLIAKAAFAVGLIGVYGGLVLLTGLVSPGHLRRLYADLISPASDE